MFIFVKTINIWKIYHQLYRLNQATKYTVKRFWEESLKCASMQRVRTSTISVKVHSTKSLYQYGTCIWKNALLTIYQKLQINTKTLYHTFRTRDDGGNDKTETLPIIGFFNKKCVVLTNDMTGYRLHNLHSKPFLSHQSRFFSHYLRRFIVSWYHSAKFGCMCTCVGVSSYNQWNA